MKIITPKFALLLVNGLFILNFYSFSQSTIVNRENFLEAESYFIHEEFSEALPVYIQLKEKYPGNYNLDYRIGRCYLYLPYEKGKAIGYLEKAVKHISAEYKEGKFTENNAPGDALFYLADAYRVNNQLDKAITTYKSFKNQVNSTNYDVELIDYNINTCYKAIEAKKKPVDTDEMNLGNIINTRYSETNPVVTPNEDVIVYASKLPFYQAMFYSKKVNGVWTQPVNMIPEIGVDNDCYPTCISYDGNELYLYRSNDYRGDIYVTNYINNKWTKIKKLNTNINTKYWESHATLSREGKTLYFTSNREGGFGGLDIYKSIRESGGDWGPAINLGPAINSKYNEETPFIMPDGNRLYFSSYGHESIGGYDIFYSDQNSNSTWSKPKNIGYPVNTTDDDLFYSPIRDGSIAYTSCFDPNGFGRHDIIRLKVYTYENPRKYLISGTAKLQNNTGQTPVYYVALYDKIKNDTVLRKKIVGDNISFETTPGKYDVYIYSDQNQSQKQPLTILWGSKETNRQMNFELATPAKVEQIAIAENYSNNSLNKKATGIKNSEKDNLSNALTDLNKENSEIQTNKPESIIDTIAIDTKSQSNLIDSNKIDSQLTYTSGSGEISEDISHSLFSKVKFLFGNNLGLALLFCSLPLVVIFWIFFKRRKKKEK